ncbi:MAG: GEVED domain-containing protein [Chryseobacterium sp.]|uniref:GEVED domain-containing protein n=1 Tax=Chryseobacterium sp. TaxID=1871047 RepID=UPI0025BD536B|nr:GEVED domain-containing protein [Chryseobacterium sp.]MCJ7933467.1 GEVED domain-containing protein [Chryseobacterium sp.]
MVFGLFLQAQTVTIGPGTSTQRYPLGSFYGFERSASLYAASEINVPAGGSILSVAWNATASTSVTLPVKIYLKAVPSSTTTLTAQDWATVTGGSTLVYSGNVSNLPTGWNTVTLQSPFYYNGTDNVMVMVETNYGGSGGGSSTGSAITYSTATSRHMYYQADSNAPTGTGTVTSSRPNIQMTFGAPPSCLPPGALSLGTVTPTSAVLNWTAPSTAPAGGYDVYYSTSSNAPTAATTPSQNITAGTSAPLSPLAANTTYYAWVRSKCSATDQSWWVGPISFYTGYCTPTGGNFSTSYYLNSLNTTGGISNIDYSATSYTGYVNSGLVASAIPTSTLTVNLKASGNSTYYYYVWVDWNNNMSFNDPGETILATTSYAATGTATISIPSTQAPGNYRVRCATSFSGQINSCGNASYGNYVDFTLSVIALQPCNTSPPSNIAVSNITASSALVTWVPATGATYVLQYRKQGSGPTGWQTINITAPLSSSQLISNLTDATQYEYQIATICGGAQGPYSTIGNFTTPALGYCDPSPVNTTSDGYINKVVVTPTNAPLMVSDSGYDVYKDYTTDASRTITLVRGTGGNTISVNKYWPGSTSSYGVVAWIDYNRNGIFEATEKVLDTPSNTTTPVNATFAVPALPNPAIYNGTQPTRMRVAMKQYGVPAPCGSFGTFDYGEVEDYTVRFIDQPVCSTAPPTNITVSNLTATSATFSWVFATGATYNLRYRKISPAPVGAYTTVNGITGNTYTIPAANPLTEQTQYEVQVATVCGTSTGGFSTAIPFTTPPLSYCQMTGSGNNDHISNVTVTSSNLGVPPMNNTSVQTNYISYTTPQTLITLDVGSLGNKISVAKGWTGATNNDAVTAWIDWNRDGQFVDSERILISAASTTTPVIATFDVPTTAYPGPLTTTMRVVLKRTSAPVMCQNAVNGEVEDYRVMLRPCSNVTPNAPTFTRTHNSATISWTGVTNNVSYIVRYRVQGTTTWTEVYASTQLGNIPLVVNGLTPATTYEVEIAAICGNTIGTATTIKTFTTRCDPTPPNVTISTITPTTALITWAPLAASSTYVMRYRVVGSGATGWVTVNLPAAPANTYVLGSATPLVPYTSYEVQIANQCSGETTLNPYSNPKVFITERICEIPPPGLTITQLLPTMAEVKWDPFPGATYVLRYRKVGIPSWTEVPTPVNNLVLNGLTELTKYEMQVVNICNGTPGNYTPLYYFTTPTVVYCNMSSDNFAGEHIAKVTVNPTGKPMMENASGASSYTDYTGDPKKFIEMVQGSTDNEIIIEKKWTGTNYNEGIAVWIDFNRNGEFDINERVFTSAPNTTTPVSGKFSVPADAFVSMTDYKYVVMRVAMQRDGVPVTCVNPGNGEVEDYTVRISKKGISNPTNQTDILIYPNPVSTTLYVKNISKRARYKIYNAAGQVIADGILLNNQINVSKLINGVYVIDIDDNGNTVQKKFIKE